MLRSSTCSNRLLVALGLGIAAGCATPSDGLFESEAVTAALGAVTPAAIERHIRVLADDSLEGRAPGTRGFEGASRYVESFFASLGLEPAGVNGFRQPVPLQQSTVNETASTLSFTRGGAATDFVYAEDFTLAPDAMEADVTVSGPVVFVGYGVSAPGAGYDDYGDIDVEGKIVAYLAGAPPSLPGDQRAYYSSGSVKRDEAARRGATGMISFTSPDDPRFRWAVGVARTRRGSFGWLDESGALQGRSGPSPVRGAANLNRAAIEALFEGAPVSLDAVFSAAQASTPQSFVLPLEATLRTVSTHRRVASHNLVARLPGNDPDLAREHVVYVGHLDHFGIGDTVDGDSIYNGAHDNASGTAIVMEIARAFSSLPDTLPRRSVLFLVVTAEEWGLLGSDYFVNHPTVPRSSLVANMSLDMPFLFHPLLDIVPYGAEHSSLSGAVVAAARHLGMEIGPDPIPEQVLFIRSDHYSFIRQGIPALFIKSGFETGDERDGGAINTAFRQERYHTPGDEWDQGFDYGAGVSHAHVNFLTGLYVAMQDERPVWNAGDFFGGLFAGGRP